MGITSFISGFSNNLPTVWQLLIPSLTVGTVIGALLLFIGIFKAGILNIIGKLLDKITNGRIEESALRKAFIIGGISMIWIPNIVKGLLSSTEGIILTIGIFFVIILITILLSKGKKKTVF